MEIFPELKGKENVLIVEDNKEIKRLAKQIVEHPHPGILLRNEKEWTVDTYNNLDGSQGLYDEWSQSQKVTYYLISLILKLQNYSYWDQANSFQGLGIVSGKECDYKGKEIFV